MDKVENFLATFQIFGSLRIQLWIVLKCVKNYYKPCILLLSLLQSHGTVNLRIPICRSSYYYIDGNTMGDNTWRTYAFRELDQNISPLNISDLSAIRLVVSISTFSLNVLISSKISLIVFCSFKNIDLIFWKHFLLKRPLLKRVTLLNFDFNTVFKFSNKWQYFFKNLLIKN